MTFSAVDRRLEGKTILRQCQLTELYLLDIFVEICEKYNLQYFLCFGTLLGAMRHNGFIPWDDDLDVCMPEKDFKTFCRIAKKEMPKTALLQCEGDPGHFVRFARIRDRLSFFCEDFTQPIYPSGIILDIYPLISVPLLPQKWIRFFTNVRPVVWTSQLIHRTKFHTTIIGVFVSGIKALVWKLIEMAINMSIGILKLIRPTRLHVIWESAPYVYQGFSLEQIYPLTTHIFEGKQYSIPKESEQVLEAFYGNWKQLPSQEQQQGHHSSIILPTTAPNAPWALSFSRTKR